MAMHEVTASPINGEQHEARGRAAPAAGPLHPREPAADRHPHRLRHDPLRRLHGPARRRPVKSCTVFAVQADGREITTVEGLEQDGKLHPIQEGFWERARPAVRLLHAGHDDDQRARFLESNPNPSEDEIRRGISGNLCRCTGYVNIVKAVQHAAAKLAGRRVMALTHDRPKSAAWATRIKRKEDPRFLRGKGNYVDDVKLPGMLYMDIVRSPYAHAKITNIDATRPLAIPGVLAVITGEDLGQVQPALDADADVGHPDGAAGREGHVPGAGGRGGHRHQPLHRRRRRGRGRGRLRAAAGGRRPAARRSSRTRRCCAPTRRTRRTITSGTGRRATGPRPTAPSPRPTSRSSRTSTSRASTSPRSRPAAASPTSTRSAAS